MRASNPIAWTVFYCFRSLLVLALVIRLAVGTHTLPAAASLLPVECCNPSAQQSAQSRHLGGKISIQLLQKRRRVKPKSRRCMYIYYIVQTVLIQLMLQLIHIHHIYLRNRAAVPPSVHYSLPPGFGFLFFLRPGPAPTDK